MTSQTSVRAAFFTACVVALMCHVFAVGSSAQNGSQFTNWSAFADGAAPVRPKLDCRTLLSLTGYQFSIETARLVPATPDLPEHCHVTGQILPEIRFEVALPTNWKRRFYMFGNGGYAGESLGAPARINSRNMALRQGFVVGQHNTGHDAATEPLATFAANRQKLLDYAYRAVHVTAETSKELIRRYYGIEPAKSYFDGCSTGGRQGLMSAQRFPADFDGIAVGAPVLNFTDTMIGYISELRALEAAPIPLKRSSCSTNASSRNATASTVSPTGSSTIPGAARSIRGSICRYAAGPRTPRTVFQPGRCRRWRRSIRAPGSEKSSSSSEDRCSRKLAARTNLLPPSIGTWRLESRIPTSTP
jgi:tannase/feruloyl esterase